MSALLLAQHNNFIQRAKKNGAKTLKYKTPCCSKKLEDLAAPKGCSWDTLCTCPYCESLYMKFSNDKRIVGQLPPDGVATS